MKCFVILSAHEQLRKAWFCIVDNLVVPCKIPLEDKQLYLSIELSKSQIYVCVRAEQYFYVLVLFLTWHF